MSSAVSVMLNGINSQWLQLRQFAYSNRTIFEVGFIVAYAGEQATLILLTELFPEFTSIVISLFALVVLTTFAFHKLLMESRIRLLEEHVKSVQQDLFHMSTAWLSKEKIHADIIHKLLKDLSPEQNLNMRESSLK